MKRPVIFSDDDIGDMRGSFGNLSQCYRELRDYVLLLEEQLPDAMAHAVFFDITTVKPEPPVA